MSKWLICLFIICVTCKLFAQVDIGKEYPISKLSLSLSVSPRYCNWIIDGKQKDQFINSVGYTFFNYNLNFYYRLKGKRIFFATGFHLLNYGYKENNVLAYHESQPGVPGYDSISVKRFSYFYGIPMGVGKGFSKNGFSFLIESGLINNIFDLSHSKPIGTDNEMYERGGSYPSKNYYLTVYVKFGVKLTNDKVSIIMSPIYNSSFYNIYSNPNEGFLLLYQLGVDCGIIFKII